ncbi:interferon-inducible GTPase 5-like [Ambystoma mexicanum]|uniref:interferon-inducible GTPase 5-like n=1 Tax=Ambystoma mexicanum TaxID=8296 RepID=UPI0037E98134
MAGVEDNYGSESFEMITDEEVAEVQAALEKGDLTEAASTLKKSLESLENAQLDIAITGESGSGKSTFVNAIRGMEDEVDGAAKTGVVETTMLATPYQYHNHSNVTIWDLPGIGTPMFKADTYLETVNFSRYDFFILIASERFKENHIQLALEIQRMGKKFYFVRSKVDSDLYASQKRRKTTYNEERILKEIRDNCIDCLKEGGIASPKVFLLSCCELGLYDFQLMQDTLERELPSHKRHAFLLSLPNISVAVLQKKKEALKQQIWKLATISSAVAVIPIPGLSVVCDVTILIKAMRGYLRDFGLDEESLRRLAARVEKPEEELRAVIKSPLVVKEITREIVYKLMSKAAGASLMVVEYALSTIPIFGSVAAGGLSFATTYYMLQGFLKEIAEDAERVLTKALESTV